ncbi:hypothetical protein PTI98_009654 [Pleurotus ostreatus]|nr:hypothetical protein PTI98_009654 [Pleurotus ostreatus]
MLEAERGSIANKSSQKRKMDIDTDDSDGNANDDADNDGQGDTTHERPGKSITISKTSISQKRPRWVDNSDVEIKDQFLSEQQATRKYIIHLQNKFQTEKHNHAETRRA